MPFALSYVLVFLVSFATLRAVIALSQKYQLFIDSSHSSKPQRFHYQPTPRAGGVGILAGVLVGFGALCLQNIGLQYFEAFGSEWVHFLIAGVVVFASGFLEDMGVSLSPKLRLLIQCIGASIVCAGMSNAWLRDLGLGFEFPFWLGLAFGVFAVVGVCNAINIIDGFNGLSGGVALCVCASIIIVSTQVDMPLIASVAAIMMSATLGFLVLNFPSGKIFLGDGGAYFLGFGLAMILVLLTQEPSSIVSPWYGFCVMIYPIWEVLFSIVRKVSVGKSAMQPDSLHLHMLLFKRLRNNPLTSLIIVCVNIPFIAIATLFYANTLVLMITCVAFIIGYVLVYRLFRM
ncbi:hypothetical protein BKN38_03820 [Helicobacter sp. CLO-3]|uniref:glycosyltransferase family 4 protein n=1 Tax=unclassified Helicobacter TaxID=2593540 RepID=UPI0008058AD6|nr:MULTISPECIES: MraY family glycosyltransferase [unclassified Helicobacter]OBV29380.1 hypothetical protein BA723_05715 [Helicobacter sp. CLO-3]OHU84161.1 hypothetical protein BKN38_03820 [Helicobacter sp. CLO-3]